VKEFKNTNLLSLQNREKKINLIGPIKVRATGPNTFSIVDSIDPIEIEMETVIKETNNKKRGESKNLANHLAFYYSSTTKRPSLHFEDLEEPSLKFHRTPKRSENISFRHSTTSIPANVISSTSSKQVKLHNPTKSDWTLYQEGSNPYKTKVTPASVARIGQRQAKQRGSFRFEDDSQHSLKVRFVETSDNQIRSKNVIFPEK